MAKGKYVLELLKAYKDNDSNKFYQVSQKLLDDELSKKNSSIGSKMKRIVNSFDEIETSQSNHGKSQNFSSSYFNRLPRDERTGTDLISIIKPKKYLGDIILSNENRQALETTLLEFKMQHKLREYKLNPKKRIIFCGPPGCGKTITAKALANELGVPLLYIHMDSLISSYLGDTASNLRQVFNYANSGNWIIFFDEFDTISKSRDDKNEHGELKRSVNSLLQLIDNFDTKNIMIAATNHQHLLDGALWRRFDDILYFDKPNKNEIARLISIKLRNIENEITVSDFIEKLYGMNHSQIERICFEAYKKTIMSNKSLLTNKYFAQAIKDENRRMRIYFKESSDE